MINGSMVEIEIQDGRIICLLGSRGELILRTGYESYVFSPLFKLTIPPEKTQTLFNAVIDVLKNNHEGTQKEQFNYEAFSMISGVCLMALAKINDLPVNNYELNLSHDEMLLFGLALNLARENGDKDTHSVIRYVM